MIDKVPMSYDPLTGHSMYINYFSNNFSSIDTYRYIWFCENDVYYPESLKQFTDQHKAYTYDLLVPEYGLRPVDWCWKKYLQGFSNIIDIGITGVIMRMSQRLLKTLILNIDKTFAGFFEISLPHLCIANNFTIHKFLLDTCGVVTIYATPIMKHILDDIKDNTKVYIEKKIYHPVKM
jgi:hypothetical protein